MCEINEDIAFCETREDADIVIFGAPFDGTVSYRPGTRFGPQAIFNELFGIETYSPLLNMDLADYKIYNEGELSLPFGNTQKAMDLIYNKAADILKSGKKPFMLGGEHLVSYGSIKAAAEKYSELYIIHLDAHADLRQAYMGEELSHAAVMRRAWELLGDGRIYQFGIRSSTKAELDFAKEHTITRLFDLNGIQECALALKGKKVYITIDIDVLDPSLVSGTGTPEAGGITYKELEQAFTYFKALDIVGADLVELAPHYDHSGTSTAVACKIVREMLLCMNKA